MKASLIEAAEDEDISASELVRRLIEVFHDWRTRNHMDGWPVLGVPRLCEPCECPNGVHCELDTADTAVAPKTESPRAPGFYGIGFHQFPSHPAKYQEKITMFG